MCVSEKKLLSKKYKIKTKPGYMYSIPKLCIQKNLPNTTNCENK